MAVASPMAAAATSAETGQPKAALHYRQGGDHCGVCMYYQGVDTTKGTCPRVTPPDVDAADLCDDFARAGREKPDREVGGTANDMANNLQRRGLISDKAMTGLRGRDY